MSLTSLWYTNGRRLSCWRRSLSVKLGRRSRVAAYMSWTYLCDQFYPLRGHTTTALQMAWRETEIAVSQHIHNFWCVTICWRDPGAAIRRQRSALFTNVLLDETIQILAKKAFSQNWFNEAHNLNVELQRVATKHQLFQFNCSLYEQIDGEAMGG